ncbi:hypothetical protein [Clostridium thailandense]|uniref:hypothetical protein n=1 Tax=Clostridium thailandense TaxID=2794346 RepID=UPI003988D999
MLAIYNKAVSDVTEVKAYVSKKGQTLSAYADSTIGKKIVSAAERNSVNAWHAKPIGTWAISKLPKESELLAFGKNLTNKGVGVTATVSLGLSAWDDFYHYGTRVGSKRFAVDVLGAGVSIGIGILTAPFSGGVILGLGLTMLTGYFIFEPWKKSINE